MKHYPFHIHEFLSKHAVESIDDLIVQTPSTVTDTSDVKQSRDIKKSVEREERKRLKIIEKIESNISQKEEMLKLIDGEFPDYDKVLPKNNPHTVKINKKNFYDCIDRVSTVANDKHRSVKLTLETGKINLQVNTSEGSFAYEEFFLDPYFLFSSFF